MPQVEEARIVDSIPLKDLELMIVAFVLYESSEGSNLRLPTGMEPVQLQ